MRTDHVFDLTFSAPDITAQAHPAHATCAVAMRYRNLLSGHASYVKELYPISKENSGAREHQVENPWCSV
jgi:hypothetical protein